MAASPWSAIPTMSRIPWRKVSAAGFAGMCFSFVNYLDEFPFFRDEVLPRLERMGLRAMPRG